MHAIKAAYRRLAKSTHPDAIGGAKSAALRFARITEAYAVARAEAIADGRIGAERVDDPEEFHEEMIERVLEVVERAALAVPDRRHLVLADAVAEHPRAHAVGAGQALPGVLAVDVDGSSPEVRERSDRRQPPVDVRTRPTVDRDDTGDDVFLVVDHEPALDPGLGRSMTYQVECGSHPCSPGRLDGCSSITRS